MTAPHQDFSEFTDKRVNLTIKGEQPQEGKVELGTPLAVLIKFKGKSQTTLVEADKIAKIEEIGDKVKPFTAKKLKAVETGSVRAHLLERHGVTLTWANAVTEEQALEYHTRLDHAALQLGHVHRTEEDDKGEREAAIEQAAGSTDEEGDS